MIHPQIYCLGPLALDRILEVDRLPGPDDKVFIKAKREAAGGPPHNVAAALVGWGKAVSLASVIGDDAVGMSLLGLLNDAGIGSEAINVVPDLETATTVIVVDETGARAILIDPIPDPVLAAIGRDVAISRGDAIVANMFHRTAVADVFERAQAVGALAILDLEWPELQRWGWDAGLAAAARASVVSTNTQVMRAFAEREGLEPGIDAALALAAELRPVSGKVCVTLGASGVIARNGSEFLSIPALPVQPRDTTGAGDRFLAGLVHTLQDRSSFDLTLRRAVAAAGLFLGGEPHDWKDVVTAARRLTGKRIADQTA
jgi:sugar/nucleoside kinase (ribokinase family)